MSRCLAYHPFVAWGKKLGDGKTPGVLGRLLRDHIIFPLFVGRGAGKGKEDAQAWIYEFPSEWETTPARR